jgi:hypothetical protein
LLPLPLPLLLLLLLLLPPLMLPPLLLQVSTVSSDLAKHYPGYNGGGFFIDGKLRCRRKTCPPTPRIGKLCIGGASGCLIPSGCKYTNAPNGAVCDVNNCIQGLCWDGVCMGGAPAKCPNNPQACMQVLLWQSLA